VTQLVEFKSQQDASTLVEVEMWNGPIAREGPSAAGVIEAGESLERVHRQLGPVVRGIVSQLGAATEWPDQVEVGFGGKLSADANVIIARTGSQPNFRIAMTWSHDHT
jgi:hypothetical protein